MLRFGSEAQRDCHQDGLSRPKVFNFLGFTHFVSRSRSGRLLVGRQTEGKRFRSKLKALKRALRVAGGNQMAEYVRQHLEGHIQYYGVSGNTRRVTSYYFASGLLFQGLNRRSQSRSLTGERFGEVIVRRLPRGRILHNVYSVPLWRTQTGSRIVSPSRGRTVVGLRYCGTAGKPGGNREHQLQPKRQQGTGLLSS